MSIMVSVETSLLIQGGNLHDVADAIMDHLVLLSETDGSDVLDSAVDADGIEGSVAIGVTVRAADMGGGERRDGSDPNRCPRDGWKHRGLAHSR